MSAAGGWGQAPGMRVTEPGCDVPAEGGRGPPACGEPAAGKIPSTEEAGLLGVPSLEDVEDFWHPAAEGGEAGLHLHFGPEAYR